MRNIEAYSYRRFSSRKQELGDSLERQDRLARTACEEHKWRLNTSLKPDKGISAFKGKNASRGHLGGFLSLVQSGMIQPGSILVLEAIDRLTRQPLDESKQLFRKIVKSGIGIYVCNLRKLYTAESLNNMADDMMLTAMFEIAYRQSKDKSDRLASVWTAKAKDAAKGRVTKWSPSWLEPTETGFEVIEGKATVIRQIFDLADNGLGVQAITRQLNKHAVPCVSWKGKNWAERYVWRLLTGRAVLGEYAIRGKAHPNYYPAVIDDKQFDRVQLQIRKRKFQRCETTPRGTAHLLQGLFHDIRDNCSMRISLRGRKEQQEYRIVSNKAYKAVKGCRIISYAYSDIEAAFLRLVKEIRPIDLLPPKQVDSEATTVQNRLHVVSRKIANYKQKLREIDGSEVLVDVVLQLESEQKELRERLSEVSHDAPLKSLGDVQDLVTMLAARNGKALIELRIRLRALIRRLVDKILVLVAFKEWKPAMTKKATRVPKTIMTKSTGVMLGINFVGGGFRTIVVGDVPQKVREKWGCGRKETYSVMPADL